MAYVWQASILDGAGNVIPRALVEVRDTATGELATLYADQSGATPQRNPFRVDYTGFARFYADAGTYMVRALRGSYERRFERVVLGESQTYYVWQQTLADRDGNILPQCEVEFRDKVDNSIATLYADHEGAVELENPFRSDNEGFARCYVVGGLYRITVRRGVSFRAVYEDVRVGPTPEFRFVWQAYIINEYGTIQPNTSIYVINEDDGSPATIYADGDGTPRSNPFLSTADGFAQFWAEAGRYRIRARRGCVQRIFSDVLLGAGVFITSRPYPYEFMDQMSFAGSARDGALWPRFLEELSFSATCLGGDLNEVFAEYDDWPPEELDFAGTATGGTLTSVLLEYEDWPPEELDFAGTCLDGTLDTVLISYVDWPAEELDFSGTCLGGTLATP